MKLVKNKSGVYSVRYSGSDGKEKSTILGVTQLDEAKLLVKELKIADMERAAKLDILSREVYSKLTNGEQNYLDVVHEFKTHTRKLATSQSTLNTYSAIYNQFARDYKYDKSRISDVSNKHIYDFINRADKTTLANRKLRLTALNSLFKFALAKGYLQINPASLVKVDKSLLSHKQKEVGDRQPITQWEYEQIIKNAPYFFKQATQISYWTGLRLGDITSLEWDSISPKSMIVWTTKRDKRVRIPLGHELFGGNELIHCLKSIDKLDKQYCFPDWHKSYTNQRTRSKASVYYNRLLERLLIANKSFHCLRHSFTTRLFKAGVMLEDIGKLVGHSSTKTTEGYVHD